MKKKKGFNLIEICGEKVVVADGKENIDFCNIVGMNETAAFLWENIKVDDFNAEGLARLLVDNYEVDAKTALHDSEELVAKWLKAGIISK